MDHSSVTDSRLADLEALYRRRFRVFLLTATGILRDEERALDAVQEGFAAAIRERRRFRGDGPLEAWVWRMVVNAALKQLRARSPLDVEPSLNGAAPSKHPELRMRISALPERQRTVLFLRYFADLDYRTIGSVLGISPGTVGATLNAAHTALRRTLEEVRE
jgi:RNA polymerase sigma factor (sigma-70 family)